MENRRFVHNDWNQIEKVHGSDLKKKSKSKHKRIQETEFVFKHEPKTFETEQCQWCSLQFKEKAIYCSRCRCCQFCGMQMFGTLSCQVCGNRINKHDKIKSDKFIIH